MIALIDADTFKYASAAVIEHYDREADSYSIEPISHAYYNCNSKIKKILKTLQPSEYEVHLTKLGDKTNYRLFIDSNYKQNRTGRKPHHLQDVHNFILKRYSAKEQVGQEADDSITIRHYALNSLGWDINIRNSIIVSIDKDFDTVPGWHFNPNKKIEYFVTELEAKQNFYLQILTGDTADNVPRVKKGWRQAKTEEKIRNALTEEELIDIVMKEIAVQVPEQEIVATDYMTKIGQLLHLRTKPGELWSIPR